MVMKNAFFLLPLLLVSQVGWAQEPQPTQEDSLRFTSKFVLPITFYTPETRWGFGGAGLLAFRLPGEPDSSRSSQLQGGGVYTLENQLLTYLSYILFRENEDYWLYGEVGYYRYTFFFYGIGNEDQDSEGELFSVNFPRFRIHALKQVVPNGYLGLHYWLDVFDIQDVAPQGRLADDQRDIAGRNGGIISGPGLIGIYDRRNDLNFPTKGVYAEALFQVNAPWTGSSFNYTRTSMDLRGFWSPFKQVNHVLAGQVYADLTTGEPPFNALALLGGTRRLRGFYEGRYRDNRLIGGQIEYRAPLFWRIGVNAFVGTAAVFDEFSEINPNIFRLGYGAGLRARISNEDYINLRFDVGVAEGQVNYYLTVGEAF